jgi:hypothetical protein
VIAATVHSFYTLDARTRRVDRMLLLYGGTMFAVMTALPLPLLAAACCYRAAVSAAPASPTVGKIVARVTRP